jgi:hypothetical protein
MKITFTKEMIKEAIKSGCRTISELNNFISQQDLAVRKV